MPKPTFIDRDDHPALVQVVRAKDPPRVVAPPLTGDMTQMCQTCKSRDVNGGSWVDDPCIKIEVSKLRLNSVAFDEYGLRPGMIFAMYVSADERYLLFQQIVRKFERPQDVYRAGLYTIQDARTTSRPHTYGNKETWAGYFKQSHRLTVVETLPRLANTYGIVRQHPDSPNVLFVDTNRMWRNETVRAQRHKTIRSLASMYSNGELDEFDGR